MSLTINHNIASLNAQRNVTNNKMNLNKALERLSSGLRINRASDDAAGLVISEQMRSQITGLNQAVSNSETATSMVQTGEGALDEVNSLLNKARTLALHSANDGANDSNQLAADQNELDNVITTINRISDVTQFGTKKLLDGSLNGATTLGAGITRVNVGNLANNSAVAVGQISVAVTGYTKEANALVGGATDSSSYVFTAAVVGMAVSGATLRSGTTSSLTIGSDTYSFTTSAGGLIATGIADKYNTLIASASGGYTVAYTAASSGFVVTHNAPGSTDFTAAISFSKGATAAQTGTDQSVTANLEVGNGTTPNATAAAALFDGIVALSGVTTGTVLGTTGSTYTATVTSATGASVSFTYTGTVTDTLGDVLVNLQSGIRAIATIGAVGTGGFSGATVALGTGSVASGFQIKLSRGNDAIHDSFTFSVRTDFNNLAAATPTIKAAYLNVAFYTGATYTFDDGSAAGVANLGTASGATTLLHDGAQIALTINGITKVITGAGQTLDVVASGFSTAFTATGITAPIRFLSGSETMSGASNFGPSVTGTAANAGFYVADATGTAFTMSLAVDQAVGTDVAPATTAVQAGVLAGATMDLATTATAVISGITTIAGISALAISNASGSTVNTNGVVGTGTLTTSSGLVLNLAQTNLTASGAGTYTLTPASQALGFNNFKMEISTGVSEGGGSTSFTLTNGARFQIGANASQYAGVTIDSVAAGELGRNVTGAGTLKSLNDMLSSEQSALTTGKSDQALKVIDAAVDQVTNLRGKLGGFQSNTLESGLNSLRVSSENLSAAESTIRDTDFAAESAEFTRTQILVQASTSMLAQANQLPQGVLALLR